MLLSKELLTIKYIFKHMEVCQSIAIIMYMVQEQMEKDSFQSIKEKLQMIILETTMSIPLLVTIMTFAVKEIKNGRSRNLNQLKEVKIVEKRMVDGELNPPDMITFGKATLTKMTILMMHVIQEYHGNAQIDNLQVNTQINGNGSIEILGDVVGAGHRLSTKKNQPFDMPPQ